MPIPKGFEDLVALTMKERPEKPKSTEEIWNKFLYIVFMGGRRSDPEINLIINMLKANKLLGMEYVLKTSGEAWREDVGKMLDERMQRIKDDETLIMLKEFQKELFRISASIKGSARFFEKNKISPETLEGMLSGKEKTWEFIDSLANNEDVSNIKYTKIIIWLHSLGYAQDFCPPSWQAKKFINYEIGPYYQFYEDDKYFMKKSEEFAEEIKKKTKKATTRDVAMAIFYYTTLKNMLPSRSLEKKRFSASLLIGFIKRKKLNLKNISEMLSDFDQRDELIEDLFKSLSKK